MSSDKQLTGAIIMAMGIGIVIGVVGYEVKTYTLGLGLLMVALSLGIRFSA